MISKFMWFFFASLFVPLLAWAEDSGKAIFIGHNVTPTTETLSQGAGTVGNYALAYGITDTLFIATSPWIWASYNTANVHLKWAGNVSEASRLGLFLSYFESFESQPFLKSAGTINGGGTRPGRPGGGGPAGGGGGTSTTIYTAQERYQWQSASAHGLYSYETANHTHYYFNFHYAYFWNDDFPYSIRMDPGTDTIRHQIDFTMLTQVPLNDEWNILFEFGGLGLNYLYPYMQMGASIAYKNASWLFQLGASYTGQFAELNKSTAWEIGRYDTRTHTTESGQEYYFRYLQTAVHPEIQIQYFF